ncbi:MAG TPA: hypothetical protein VHE58_04775 [Burkholderiales bacterium]|nr:hypothetical protein [Burkholderiales bacterium]
MLCFYPAVTHYAVIYQNFALGIGMLVLLILVAAALLPGRSKWLVAAVLPLLLLVPVDPGILLFCPPVIINVLGCGFFGMSLREGREPVISRIARLERGELPAELAQYTRRLTWIWTVFFALMALLSILLAAFAPLTVWSLFSNLVNYLLVGFLFFGEFVYRRIRYRHYHHAPPFQVIRSIWDKGAARLKS